MVTDYYYAIFVPTLPWIPNGLSKLLESEIVDFLTDPNKNQTHE